jgi:hypothetical protein
MKMQKADSDTVTLKKLICLFSNDCRIVRESMTLDECENLLKMEILLIEGAKSQQYLKQRIKFLENICRQPNT